MQAFSVGYPGRPDYDERRMAREFAAHLGMPFNEIELSTGEQTEIFQDLVFSQDDPIADISGFGYYAVAWKAREMGVPVLLQGQGGDELFWGYEWVAEQRCKPSGSRLFFEAVHRFVIICNSPDRLAQGRVRWRVG